MASYLIVIIVGVVTSVLATEFAIPAAFQRHMLTMQDMMSRANMRMDMTMMQGDLFSSFQAAVTEAILVATVAAVFSAIIVSLFVARRVVTPIRQMKEVSQRIAAGRYQERVDIPGDDELGQLAHSFNQMAGALEQTEIMRRDLIANVAHELRTPLSSIKGYMEGLIDGVLPPEQTTYQQLYRETDRLQRLVNDLQELSRVEAGAFQLDRQPLALAELVGRVAHRLKVQFEEKGITLMLKIQPGLPPVLADEDRINQVLLNLMGNALQYTPAGGTVTVTVERPTASKKLPHGQDLAAPHLNITVADTGIGISPEHLPHLFTRFYRVDKSRSRAGGRSGIGLTIAKHLVEAHGGHIWAESRGEHQGSLFGFSLPLA